MKIDYVGAKLPRTVLISYRDRGNELIPSGCNLQPTCRIFHCTCSTGISVYNVQTWVLSTLIKVMV